MWLNFNDSSINFIVVLTLITAAWEYNLFVPASLIRCTYLISYYISKFYYI